MKNCRPFFIILALGLFWFSPVKAQEKIDNYEVTVKMNADNSINITERIDYDFGDLEKHGIYRDIPYIYENILFGRHTNISQIAVVDENNQPYVFTVSNSGNDKRIKIGQEDSYVTGLKTYVISYKVDNPYIFKKDYDQLYWDIIGGAWAAPIDKSLTTVWLPKPIDYKEVLANCYFGGYGVNNDCSSTQYLFENDNSNRLTALIFRQNQIRPEGILTILISIPKGVIVEPSTLEKIGNFLAYNWIIFLPVLLFIVLFMLWYKHGRDPRGRGNIIVQYDVPDNLSPGEVGVIVDEKVHSKDISAEIIYLAIRGYLKITRLEKQGVLKKSADYLLEKLKDEKDLPNDYQQELLANLFHEASSEEKLKNYQLSPNTKVAVLLSDLDKAYQWRTIVEEKLQQAVVDKGYFVKNINKTRSKYMTWFLLSLIPFVVFFGVGGIFNNLAKVAIALSFVIIILFAIQMPKKTKAGVLAREHILGLKEYLSVAEKDRLEFHNAPEKNPEHFEALLPYAMALGVEKQWAKQFEGIYKQDPVWCAGFYVGAFNSSEFVGSLNSFGTQAKSTFATPGSSGGGGFAGGGGGGGGGGSW